MIRFAVPLVVLFLAGLQTHTAPEDDPLATFELHPDFQIELIAEEPVVADPIDMEIDEYGRLYVLEFHSYPDNWSGVDRIMLLEDTDGDGVMDGSTVFKDSLVQSMGIMRWKNGIIATAPPDVIYLEDTDGDGRADVERTLLTGFHQGDGEGDVNSPTYGLDNWIYLGNRRTSGNDVYFPERPDGPRIDAQNVNRNLRFRPDTYELEAQSSGTQYGLTFDTWGHELFNSNRNHVFEEIVAARYLDRNPDLLVSGAMESISDHGAASKIFPITTNPDYQILTDVGEITSACGITFYDGGIFPDEFANVSFVGEPSHNLVHVDRLLRDGPTLTASRIRPHNEFLASTDANFRPVNHYVGPDGALYVVDYHRKIIEGPEWIADEVLESENIYEGTDQGRIFRITPKGTPPAGWTAGLDVGDASNEELVRHLANPNGWWRRTAQRLLVERDAQEVSEDLEALALADFPLGRLHALWTLDGLGRLGTNLVLQALEDPEPGVRENAIRLSERYLGSSDALRDALVGMTTDPDGKVRFQLLLTLGYLDSPEAAAARQDLLFTDIDDEWTQIAALSSPHVQEGDVLETVLERYEAEYASFVQRLSALAAANRPFDRVQALLDDAVAPTAGADWQAPVLNGLAQGLDRRRLPAAFSLDGAVDAFFEHPSAPVWTAALELLETTGLPADRDLAVSRALELAQDVDAASNRRAQAMRLLTLDDPDRHVALFMQGVDPKQATEVQVAAFRALGEVDGTLVSRMALDNWSVLTQTVRDAALDAVLDRPFDLERVEMLLDGIEDGIVQPASIGWGDKVTLMRDIPDDMKQRARALIQGPQEQVRQETVEYVRSVAEKAPSPEQGRSVFYQECARCHALGGVAPGGQVGPDLMSVRGWTAADIVDQIVRPSEAIVRGYELWQLELEGGDTVEGMIASETANAVTLRDANGQETTYARSDIVSLTSLDASVMPSGYSETITEQQMADLVAFIRVGE